MPELTDTYELLLATLRQERNAPEQRLLRWAVDVDPLTI